MNIYLRPQLTGEIIHLRPRFAGAGNLSTSPISSEQKEAPALQALEIYLRPQLTGEKIYLRLQFTRLIPPSRGARLAR